MLTTSAELDKAMHSAWSDLESFFAVATEESAPLQDANGWSIKDHVTHMAVWGDSVGVLFRGGARHEALGIDPELYATASFDEINEIIKKRETHLSLTQAIARLREVHRALTTAVRSLSDADLVRTVADVFPRAPRTDNRRVVDFIYENSAAHYSEHLPWMRGLIRGPA